MVKKRVWPGSRTVGPITGSELVSWLSTTRTLVRTTLPLLLTLPVMVINSPGATGAGGQNFRTNRAGTVMVGQDAVAVAETLLPQMLVAVTVSVSETGPQSLAGVK